jgi:copper chaperone NosL
MKTSLRVFGVLVLLATAACTSERERPRCAECGMVTDADPRFTAGASRGEEALRFDSPKCLFRYLNGQRAGGAREPWVTTYYDQRRVPTEQAVYVVGSNVRGPMGDDLIPLESHAAAAQFATDHGGRVVEHGAIDRTLLEELL